MKGKKTPTCKADFPKLKQCSDITKIVCPGVAKKHGLRVSGRRNALGSILGKRKCEWFSGTAPPMAALFRTNTHTAPNYRVAVAEKTHESTCKRDCVKRCSAKKMQAIAQRAWQML